MENTKLFQKDIEIPKDYLFYQTKILISTKHGPHGGDEINLINLNSDPKIQNFGWLFLHTANITL